jgi:hypothetical protein
VLQNHRPQHSLIARSQDEADVHGIGMANGDGGLQVLEQHMPLAAERIGTENKIAEILHLNQFNAPCGVAAPNKERMLKEWCVLKDALF